MGEENISPNKTSSPSKHSAKRCLFPTTDEDHGKNKIEMELENKDIIKRKTEEWSFDFSGGKPTKGKFEWEKVFTTEDPRKKFIREADPVTSQSLSPSCSQMIGVVLSNKVYKIMKN